MKFIKNNTGITLIALIITIIVLLILTGVSIGTLTGENGILNKAGKAKEKTKEEQIKEEIELAIIEIQTEKLSEGKTVTLATLANGQLEEKLQNIIANLGNNEIVGQYKGYEYIIDDKFHVIIGGKAGGIYINYELSNYEYTNQDILLTIHAISTNGEITNIEGPSQLIQNSDNTYTITQNGNYEFTATNSTGQTKTEIVSITNIDKIEPIIELITDNVTFNSISLVVSARDEQSGLAESDTYQYYLENTLQSVSSTNRYTFTELSYVTSYQLRVVVTDKAGNTAQKSITVETTGRPVSSLKSKEYVNYIDKKGITRKCIVLYDATSNYGIQIITEDIVESIRLGSHQEFNLSRDSYNNAIATLNAKANEYLNLDFASSARCVGSVPNNPNSESGFYSRNDSWFSQYNNTLKDGDTNYQADWDKLGEIGSIHLKSKSYWLASRNDVYADSGRSYFFIRYVTNDGSMSEGGNNSLTSMCRINSVGFAGGYSYEHGIRPVFTLKPNVTVLGKGTADSPYTLK